MLLAMKEFVKRPLLLIPTVRRYVNTNRRIAAKALALEEEVKRTKEIVARSRSPALFGSVEDLLTERLLAHPAAIPLPAAELGSQPAIGDRRRIESAERLLAAYHKALADEFTSPLKREGEDMWSRLIRTELPELMSTLEQGDAAELAQFLMNFGRSFVWFGGITTCLDGFNRNPAPGQVALTYLDKLVCLAEAIGVLWLENPEQGSWGSNLHVNVDELIEAIEDELGVSIAPPMGIIHTDGLRTKNGLLHYRHINGLYSAIQLSKLNIDQGSVCEIGGGLGITAMYSRRLGVLDYTILDLPITCLLAGHYLLQAVGPDSVVLYGEKRVSNAVKVLPYWECMNLPDKRTGATINQDSLPEIAENLINEYLVQIGRFTGGYFLSINHECFFPRTVHNLIRKHPGFKNVYRAKCWVREGYVEELYEVP